MNPENQQLVANVFEAAIPRLTRLAARLVADAEAAVADARSHFMRMIPDMAYVDKPTHFLAQALFTTSVNLAMYLALKDRGVDLHSFGGAMLFGLSRAPAHAFPMPMDEATQREATRAMIAAGKESMRSAAPGEDVFEAFEGDGIDFDFGYDIKSCAICAQYAKYDAMELVPYMCATDDIVSERGSQGLRRSGTIALGATHCDFRYKRGREPRHLSGQFPDRIRLLAGD